MANFDIRFIVIKKILVGILLLLCSGVFFEVCVEAAKPARKTLPKALDPQKVLNEASRNFQTKNYSQAVRLYKRYLKTNPTHYDVWLNLSLAYFREGWPKRALTILDRYGKRTTYKSYVSYHQGLCYLALEDFETAKKKFVEAAQIHDAYGYKAIFEIALVFYNDRNTEQALEWLDVYLKRSPDGVYAKRAIRMRDELKNSGTFIKGVKGEPLPDIESAFYKNHRYSLMRRPHYWLVQGGFKSEDGVRKDPDEGGVLKDTAFSSQALMFYGGIGLGPLKYKNTVSLVGYNLKQNWYTDQERLEEWMENMGSGLKEFFDTFPFRLDLMERRHQLYADVGLKFPYGVFAGAYGLLEFVRIGSSFADSGVEDRATNVSQRVLLAPWVGLEYYDNFQTIFYLFLDRHLLSETPEESNKTYSIMDEPGISLGVNQYFGFPKYKFDIKADFFYYDYTYNDAWLDKNRIGASAGGEFEFITNVYVAATFGMYFDMYKVQVMKRSGEVSTSTSTSTSKYHDRQDEGMFYSVGAYWDYGDFYRLNFSYLTITNKNSTLPVYDFTENTLSLSVTMAFPNIKRTIRLIDRFSDNGLYSVWR